MEEVVHYEFKRKILMGLKLGGRRCQLDGWYRLLRLVARWHYVKRSLLECAGSLTILHSVPSHCLEMSQRGTQSRSRPIIIKPLKCHEV